jgi:hypothetical protein
MIQILKRAFTRMKARVLQLAKDEPNSFAFYAGMSALMVFVFVMFLIDDPPPPPPQAQDPSLYRPFQKPKP